MKGYSAAIDAALDGRAGPGFSTPTCFALLALAAADQAGATARQLAAVRAALESIEEVRPLADAAHWVREYDRGAK